jgi:hypothetical protein
METTTITQIKVYDIQWYYNYEDYSNEMTQKEYDEIFDNEPTEMIIDVSDWDMDHDDIDNIEENISNYISEESGYYHEGYSWNWI